MLGFFFTDSPIASWEDARQHADTARFARFHRAMLERGVYLAAVAVRGLVPLDRARRRRDRRTIAAARARSPAAAGGQASA